MELNDKELLERTYRLARENNKMIHSMRRQAFWGFVFKIILYAIFIGLPIWLYFQYLAPTLGSLLEVYSQIPGVGGDFDFSSYFNREE